MDLLYAAGVSAILATLISREQYSYHTDPSDVDTTTYDFSGPSWDSPKVTNNDAWWKYHFETAEWQARHRSINPSTWSNPYERRLNNWFNRASVSREYDL